MSYRHIKPSQRVELGVLLRAGKSQREIAKLLRKDPGSISRELKRNRSFDGRYRAVEARAKTQARRTVANQRFRKIEHDPMLRDYIIGKLMEYWSPEQICGRLRKEKKKNVCHETIYQFIYEGCSDLKIFLRSQKGKYRRRHGEKNRRKHREDGKKRRIDTRPKVIDERKRIGDWEGDTVVCKGRRGGILTHVERKAGYLLGDKINNWTASHVREKTTRRLQTLPRKKRKTCTYDNGIEFSEHELTERDLGMKIYFAYPYHSWERGTNENTNGLLRQFFPKKMSLISVTQEEIDQAVSLLNNRPRKRLRYSTPSEVFNRCTLD